MQKQSEGQKLEGSFQFPLRCDVSIFLLFRYLFSFFFFSLRLVSKVRAMRKRYFPFVVVVVVVLVPAVVVKRKSFESGVWVAYGGPGGGQSTSVSDKSTV